MQYVSITGGNVTDADRQLFISSVNVVATLTDRDNLTVQSGDVCKVTANGNTYIYDGNTWIELSDTALTTDDVPEGVDINRQYYTSQRVTDYLLGVMLNASLLFNNNGNIEGLNRGPAGTYLRSNALSIAYAQIRYNEILERTTMIRENITIPANGTINMLDWLNNSNIFNDMVLPVGSPVNPFDWRTRGNVNYGMWHITNTSNAEITLERVNIDLAANFIIWNFIRTLISNIMDDNLQNGTALVRPLGINHAQIGGDAQIINTTIDLLGKFRTLKHGTGINITQTDDEITITCTITAGATNLSDLNDVSINTVANNQFLRYDTGNNKWNNRTITTDDIPQTLTNRYCDSTAIQTRLLEILTGNEDILIRRAGNIARLPVAINHNDVLTYNGVSGNMQWQAPQVGVTTLHGLQDVMTDEPPTDKMFLMYNPTNGTGVDGFWVNSLAEIDDISGLQTSLDGKIPLSTVTTSGDLIVGSGNATVNRLAKGTDNQVLTVVGGNVQWNTPTSSTNLDGLSDVTITTPANNQGLIYNSTSTVWENKALDTSFIAENTNMYFTFERVDTNLKNKYNGKGVLQVGTQNLDYTQLAAPDTDTKCLFGKSTATTGLEWRQPTTSDVSDFSTGVNNILNGKYSAKGRIQVGTANTTYEEQAAPASDFQILTSDITNLLNNTGLSWASLALNNSYFSNINIATPLNKQLLSYDTATAKWKNQTFDGTFALPLIAPNTAAYWGGTNIPFQTRAGTNTGLGTRLGGGTISLFLNGLEVFGCDGTFIGPLSNNKLSIIANTTTPSLLFGTTGSGIYSSGANSERWNWARGATLYGYIDNVSLNTQTRLDIKSTQISDFSMKINNLFNLFSFQNATGATTYLTVDTANDKVTIPRNGYYCASLQDAVIPTGINNDNFVFPINLGGGLVVENDNTPGIATFDGLNQLVTINVAGTYKIDFNLVYFPDNSSDNCEMFLLDAGGGAWQGCYKRNSAVTDKYTSVTMSTIRTWAVNDVLRPSFRSAQNAPWTLVTTSWSLVITNMLTS